MKTDLRCAACGGPLWELSHRWRIPKKDDKVAWAELAETVARSKPAREAFITRQGNTLLSKIDRQIEAFSARRPSAQREAILKDLAKERADLVRRYTGGADHQSDCPAENKTSTEQGRGRR